MENLDQFYKQYGQSLADRLPGLLPLEAAISFVFVEDIADPKEVMAAVKTIPDGGYLLAWDNFDEAIDTGGRDNYHLPLTGSFSFSQKAADQPARSAAHARCRQLVLKAFALMLQDGAEGELEKEAIQVEVRQLPLEKIGPVATSWYGYGLQFGWSVPLDLDL